MEEQKKFVVALADEQFDALAQSFLPVILEFSTRIGAREFGQSISKKFGRVTRRLLNYNPIRKS